MYLTSKWGERLCIADRVDNNKRLEQLRELKLISGAMKSTIFPHVTRRANTPGVEIQHKPRTWDNECKMLIRILKRKRENNLTIDRGYHCHT